MTLRKALGERSNSRAKPNEEEAPGRATKQCWEGQETGSKPISGATPEPVLGFYYEQLRCRPYFWFDVNKD
jgi:hypothetical protein